jgi:hypothetical protein
VTVHEEILSFLRKDHPDARVHVTTFPSGAVVIDVRTEAMVLTVHCSLLKEIGISRLRGHDDGLSGHDVVVTHARDAIAVLDRWLQSGQVETV